MIWNTPPILFDLIIFTLYLLILYLLIDMRKKSKGNIKKAIIYFIAVVLLLIIKNLYNFFVEFDIIPNLIYPPYSAEIIAFLFSILFFLAIFHFYKWMKKNFA